MDLPKRKKNRLDDYDYSHNGAYFITICTRNHKEILCKIVGDGACDIPQINLSYFGKIADKYIRIMNSKYENICIPKYVIMPNHIHLIIRINDVKETVRRQAPETVRRQAPNPTNAIVPKFISLFKRYCNQEIGEKIWQRSYYDHIIRDQNDYNEIWEYIDTNPKKWILTHKTQDA